jgi:anti-sigma B factor antagonist
MSEASPSPKDRDEAVAGFSVDATIDDALTVLRVAGELDVATAPLLEEVLSARRPAPDGRVIVDVSDLTFMDAAGLKVLIRAHNRIVAAGAGGVKVRGAAGIVRRLIEITGLTFLLDTRDPSRVSEADRSSSRPGRDVESARLDAARIAAGMSVNDLFVAYFALGGTVDLDELRSFLAGRSRGLDVHQLEVAAHAVNELLVDLGRTDRILSYASDRGGPQMGWHD